MEEEITRHQDQDNKEEESKEQYRPRHLSGMYENWFLDYASYVILERAVPDILDGLKPVQRRILHAMKELDDGRYNKVANIIGNTMKYHPHGDASIGDALVQLGQKDLLIDSQGNWGNILTGDSAAAPRYIEARLSKFALEVLFNSKTTTWKSSYDGRNKEPVTLPVKFPLLLAQGVEGIAVGLASKIMPHNFNELVDASIKILEDKEFVIYPDFPTGGLIDVTRYNKGVRGGKVRVRARIRKEDKKTLIITDIPFGMTTTSLIDSIVTANEKRKIRIKKIDDNTAENVEVVIHLAAGVSPDQTIDALYAFTNCEISISPNTCIIEDGKPRFLDVDEILLKNTRETVELLRRELQIRLNELTENLHFASLEKIFIEEKIYRKIENAKTWNAVIEAIEKGLEPFAEGFIREVTRDDIIRLTEIKIKRISKFDSLKADDQIAAIKSEMDEVKNHLEHLVDFSINYFRQIKKKYGAGRERKSEIRNFDTIEAKMVAAASEKLFINRNEGFAGTGLKKDEYVCECSDIDDIIIFRSDGTMMVSKVENKFYVGKNIIHIAVFKKNDERTVYNMVYRDGRRGPVLVKRFAVVGVTREKKYNLTKGNDGTRVLYFTANPNGEAEVIKVNLKPKPRMKKTSFEFDFSTITIKSRSARGNILSRNPVKSIIQREEGISTLGAINIWFDDTVNRLNTEERGKYLGAFKEDEKIVVFYASGLYRTYGYEVATHFDEGEKILMEKFNPDKWYTAIYQEQESGSHYVKRFTCDVSEKLVTIIRELNKNSLFFLTGDKYPRVELDFIDRKDGKPREKEILELEPFIGLKSVKARGKRISNIPVKNISILDPIPVEEEPDNDTATDEKGEDPLVPENDTANETIEKIQPGQEELPENIPGEESDDPEDKSDGLQIELDF